MFAQDSYFGYLGDVINKRCNWEIAVQNNAHMDSYLTMYFKTYILWGLYTA